MTLHPKSLTSKYVLITSLTCALLLGCSDDGERPETITKLRGLGVEQTPAVAVPGSVVSAVFHFAGPQGMQLNAATYKDTFFKYGQHANLALTGTGVTEEKLNGISHYTVSGSFTVPTDAAVLGAIKTLGSTRVRYGVSLTGSGDEETTIVDAHVFDPVAPQAAWKAPAISIAEPVGPSVSGTTPLTAKIESDSGEGKAVGWFVSAGKIKNRESQSTEWQEVPAGEQTVILTVRGYKSGAFAIKVAKVTVN